MAEGLDAATKGLVNQARAGDGLGFLLSFRHGRS
jgi:hypothetical protein